MHYTFNMGYGHVTLKDNSAASLADNKYHSVWIRRPSRYEQVRTGGLIHNVYTLISSTQFERFQRMIWLVVCRLALADTLVGFGFCCMVLLFSFKLRHAHT